MAELSEYVLEPLREGAEFTLYRGRERSSQMPILALAVAAEQPSPQSLRRLEHEYSLATELDAAWATQPLALIRQQGRPVLLFKDPGGEPLDRVLDRVIEQQDGQPLDLTRFLRIAIGLAVALGQAHRHGLIHKDVKPANALVDESGHVWLTGFGIASRLPREQQVPAPPEFIVGTLAYMSPEQTGRMNRSIDTRSDLYSLGVTLYQMLTGVLPFAAADPLEWVHCHIARQPLAPADRREVPEPLSELIVRLLAKNAEDRYQTAAGLVTDLRRCQVQWQAHGRIDSFPLGADDLSDRLLIPEKLYGREREVDTLLAAFDRVVAGGKPELVLVSGYSGIGKSAVVNELHKSLISPRALFASGKFDQFKRDIPYATVAQAFHSLIRPLLSKPEDEVRQWRDDICRTLSPNVSLVVDLVPDLKLIVGEQPPAIALPPQEAKARAQLALRRFIGVFARPEHPLALFLDDLQWLDVATLDFLEDLLVQRDLSHLLVVGAYRDNEVDSTHPLTRKLSAIRKAGGGVQEIHLKRLSSDDLVHLITDTLHCDRQRSIPVAQLVHEKTAGNPFFAIQFIHVLVQESLITFDHSDARWRWDLDAIRLKGYTDNVADLMVAKLNRLPVGTQQALQQFACIGNIADAATLSAVLEKSESETETDLWEALHQELIVRSEGSYRFAHDRIQEAAYSLIAEEARAETHLRIGRLLYAHIPCEKREEAIFEIVNQLNRGAGLIAAEDECCELAEFNLVAGKKAKASTAYVSALKYFITGEARLTNEVWKRRHDLFFQLELNRSECEFLTGEPAAAAERVEALRARAANTVELAMVTCLGIDIYTALGQIDYAVAVGRDYLRHLAIDWPLHPTDEQVRSEYERIWSQVGSRAVEDLMNLPLISDPASIGTLDVLTKVLPAALHIDVNLFALVVCRAVSLSIEHGNNDGSCFCYVWVSTIVGLKFGDYENAFRFGQLGYDLVEKHGLKRFQARTYLTFATKNMPWTRPFLACCDVARRAFEIANRAGDLSYAVFSLLGLPPLLLWSGIPLDEVECEAEPGLDFARKANFGLFVPLANLQLGLIRTLRGSTSKFGSLDHREFDEILFERHLDRHSPMVCCLYWISKLQARFFAGDFISAIEVSARVKPLLWHSPGLDFAVYEFHSALARAALWDSAMPDRRQEHFDALEAHRKQLAMWAEHCPGNFEDRVALVGAEIARIEGRSLDAIELYEQAIRSARKNGFVHIEALAHEFAGQYYAAHGFETFAAASLQNARNCYERWGAYGKVKQLDERYPRLREGRTPAPRSAISAASGQLDVETVVRASQALSSEMVLPRLIERLLRITVEHAGAERGLLILIRDGEPRIEAEATTGPGRIDVAVREGQATPSDLPQSALHYVIRTQESVLLDDASSDSVYSKDEYVRQNHSRSVLCLPIVKQAKLVGALYLENNLTPRVFTPERFTVLQLLASQAAISLENATLYTDLQLQVGLLQNLPVSAWTLKPDGTPDFVNQVWLDYSGQTLDFVRSYPEAWMTAVHPEDREAASKAFWDGVHLGQGFTVEARSLCARDLTYRWHLIQAVVLHDAEEKVLKFVGTTTDIDDQKRAEEALRESEHESRLIVDSIPGLIAVLDTSGELERVSRPVLDYFGKSQEELRQWAVDGTIHPDDRPGYLQAFGQSFAAGDPIEFEAVRTRRFDGVYRWLNMRGLPLRDRQGHVVRWYFLMTEVDDRKRAEEALRQAQGDLARINRVTTMGELAATLSHELNQPICATMTNADACLLWLGRDKPDLDRVHAAVTRIIRDAKRATEIIGRIHSQFQKGSLHREVIDINEINRETIALLRDEAVRYNISVRTELAADLPQILGDRVQLQQVAMNLIVNGFEAMRHVDGIREIVIKSQRAEDEQVLVSVSDTGIGFAPQLAEQIFDPFFTTKPRGTGMGLRICRSIIESHGGRLWGVGTPGQGATFRLILPAARIVPQSLTDSPC